ncbi:MAG: hypothetical protein ACFFG0_49720 [Candidatus Thorarchaeota archaeon]
MNKQEIYNEFKDLIDENNPDFKDFIDKDKKKKKEQDFQFEAF